MNLVTRALGIGMGALVVLAAGDARAEVFLDLYLGNASTDDADVDGKLPGLTGLPVDGSFSSEASVDDALAGGLRFGYWIDPAPWIGVAADVSGFVPEVDFNIGSERVDGDAAVVPISLLGMLRIPIARSDAMPGGRVQPYAAVGPSLFVTALKADHPSIGEFGAASADFGWDVRAGLRVLATSWLALFAEYRYTDFDAEFEDTVTGSDAEIDAEVRTHHVNVGLGFHF